MRGTIRGVGRRAGAAVGVVVLVLVGAGCAGDGDGDEDEQAVLESHPTVTGPDAGTGSDSGTSQEPPPAPEVLGTARAGLPNILLGGPGRELAMRVDVTELRRNGSLVELGFRVTNETEPEQTDEDPGMPESPAFELTLRFTENPGDPQTSDEPDDVSGVQLVDAGTGSTWVPAADEQGRCLCTDGLTAVYIPPGGSLDFAATFRDVPADPTTLDVHIPGFPAVTGVEVEA